MKAAESKAESRNEILEGLQDLQEVQAGRKEVARQAGEAGLSVQEYLRQKNRRRRMRALAEIVGLKYWPALYATGCDPVAFVAAENVLRRKTGGFWGQIAPDGTVFRGGWDSYGHHGLAGSDVRAMWFAAGCRDTPKFRAQVYWNKVAGKTESLSRLQNRLRAERWLEKNFRGVLAPYDFTNHALSGLGRLTWYSRWAAVQGLATLRASRPFGQKVKLRELNWEAVKVAQKGSRAAKRFLPETVQKTVFWGQVIGFQNARKEVVATLPLPAPGFKVATLRWLLAGFTSEELAANLLPAVRLTQIFGADKAAISRFVGARSIHDAGQFVLPEEPLQFSWAGFLAAHPEAAGLMAGARLAEAELGRVPRSLAEMRATLASLDVGEQAVAGTGGRPFWAVEAGIWNTRIYEDLFAYGAKGFEEVPAPGGSAGVASDGFHLKQLKAADPRNATIGRLVDCCQHLDGAAASCARAAWLKPEVAVWAVWDAAKLVAQALVWRSGNTLVIDSVETLGDRPSVANVFLKAAQAVVGKMGVEEVLCGTSSYGATEALASLGSGRVRTPRVPQGMDYTDTRSKSVRLAVAHKAPVPSSGIADAFAEAAAQAAAQAAQVAQVAAQAANVLMPGSGVVCEHCGAEVHPDAQVCAACGADISEWVD